LFDTINQTSGDLMLKFYNEFFDVCSSFDKFVQEHKWKKVKNRSEFKTLIESEFQFWKRVLSLLPPEKRLLKEFEWMKQCYEQIIKNLSDEPVNWKLRWLQDDKDAL
jgi:hypothetical protein